MSYRVSYPLYNCIKKCSFSLHSVKSHELHALSVHFVILFLLLNHILKASILSSIFPVFTIRQQNSPHTQHFTNLVFFSSPEPCYYKIGSSSYQRLPQPCQLFFFQFHNSSPPLTYCPRRLVNIDSLRICHRCLQHSVFLTPFILISIIA